MSATIEALLKLYPEKELIRVLGEFHEAIKATEAELARRREAETQQPTVDDEVSKARAKLSWSRVATDDGACSVPFRENIEDFIDAKIAAAMRKGDGK